MDAVTEPAPTPAQTPAVLSLSGDTRGLTTQLFTTMSLCTSNDSAAVEAFFALLNVEPENAVAVILKLFSSTASTITEDDRNTAAAARILCGLVVPNWGFARLWSQLSDDVSDKVRSGFVSALQSDPADVLIKLATVLGAWPPILRCLLRAASAVGHGHGTFAEQKMVLCILARLPTLEDASDSLSAIRDALAAHLEHSTADMRISAMAAAANVINILVTNVDKNTILYLVPSMVKPLKDCLDSNLEVCAQEALRLLVDVACASPSILRPHMEILEPAVTEIAIARSLPVGTRRLAVWLLTNVAMSAGVVIKADLAMKRKSNITSFVSRIASLLMDTLAEIDGEVLLPIVQDKESMTRVAQNCLQCLGNAIGGTTLMPLFMHRLQSSAGSDWRQSYANMVSITQLVQGCANVMMKEMDTVIIVLSNGLEQSQPAVHWVTIDAIAAIFTYLGLQMSHLTNILLSLMRFMSTSGHDPHLKEHTAQTIYEIISKSEPAMIEPIIDELLNCLQHTMGKAEDFSLVAATLASSSTARQSLLPATHGTVVVNLPQGIDHNDQTRGVEVGATTPTCNQQQANEPVSKQALIEFLKAFSNGGVTSTTSLTIIVGYQVSVEKFPWPWKVVLKSCLFVGIAFALATAGAAHSVEHHPRWLEAASTMVLFEGFYTIILGGGIVGLAHTSGATTALICALTICVSAIVWSFIFTHPRWIKKPKEWVPYQVRAGLSQSIGELWQRIKGQDDRAPQPRGGWFSKFKQIFRKE